jgi:hypothetical protein
MACLEDSMMIIRAYDNAAGLDVPVDDTLFVAIVQRQIRHILSPL